MRLQKYFKWVGIDHKTTVSADDPEANGLAEFTYNGNLYSTQTAEEASNNVYGPYPVSYTHLTLPTNREV